jgi:hypothetical protein
MTVSASPPAVARAWLLAAAVVSVGSPLLAQTTAPTVAAQASSSDQTTSPPASATPPPPEAPGGAPATQEDQTAPATREEQIEVERREKHAVLWPERESPVVAKANRLMDRGFVEGIQTGEGNNGWQLLLDGTRPNQGQTFGIGYRRSDLFHDALTVRGTAAGTFRGAYEVDFDAHLNRLSRSEDTFVDAYTKYERSPRMEFYGIGAKTSEADRTRYLWNTAAADLRAGYRFTRQFNAGVTLGYGHAHTGPSTGGDVPSIETKFDATTAPGLFDDASFLFWGTFAGFDTRDQPRGPRHGGFYGVDLERFRDVDSGRYSHYQLELNGQQFLPYFNATKVVALFVKARFAFTDRADQVVPFYLQPSLGGNFELRGFAPYRFHDNNAFVAAVEHRWYVFSGLEMALFIDSGTTLPTKGHLAVDDLNFSGGIGFRARVANAIVLRNDIAKSREGWRYIWSLSDISRRRF